MIKGPAAFETACMRKCPKQAEAQPQGGPQPGPEGQGIVKEFRQTPKSP